MSWKRLICNNGAGPKGVFIMWLAVLHGVAIKHRLKQWHLTSDDICVFYSFAVEIVIISSLGGLIQVIMDESLELMEIAHSYFVFCRGD